MLPTVSQFGGTGFGGGSAGFSSMLGTSGSESSPVNNIVEKSGQAGRPVNVSVPPVKPVKPVKPMRPLKPKAPPAPTSSGGGRGRAAMSPTATNFGL